MKSRIKIKKPIKFGKVITINDLVVNKGAVAEFEKGIRRNQPDISEEKLQEEVRELILRDNYYNSVMDEVSQSYEFELDEDEVNEKVESMKNIYPEAQGDHLLSLAKASIIKKLIYDDLSADWDLGLSDQQVTDTLHNFYKSTGQPIREFLTDKEKFNDVRKTLEEQVISERLLNAFKPNFVTKRSEKS